MAIVKHTAQLSRNNIFIEAAAKNLSIKISGLHQVGRSGKRCINPGNACYKLQARLMFLLAGVLLFGIVYRHSH